MLIVQSQVLSGVIDTKPSKLMLQEVFPTMLSDEIGNTAKKDKLILALGETWLRRSIDNREKRKYYTSQHMRLMARLLLHLRELDSSSTSNSSEEICSEEAADSLSERINSTVSVEAKEMTDFLQTSYFDMIIEAAIRCCLPYMDDIEDLKAPSNGIKLKYDLKRLVSAKWALLVKNDPHSMAATEMKCFMELLALEWGERITKVARTVLVRRCFQLKKELPSPDDVSTLTKYLTQQLRSVPLDIQNYFKIVRLVETRILLYNRRRSGEIEAIR